MATGNPFSSTSELEKHFPTHSRGRRFVLLPSMRGQPRAHPLSRDIFPTCAGAYCQVTERRPYVISPLPEMFIGYCSAGSGELVIGERTTPISAGDLIVLHRGDPVFMGPAPAGCWSLYFLLYEGEREASYANHLSADSRVIPIGAQPRIAAEIDKFVDLRASILRPEVMAEAARRLKWMLAWLGGIIAGKNKNRTGGDLMERTVALMISNIDGHLNLSELARLSGLSKFQFARQFQECSGHSPIHYFIHLKMQRACELLDSTDADIKDIAECLGYHDPYYFSRIFKRAVGLSPQQYRQTNLT